MIHSFLGTIIASSSLAITRDRDVFSSCFTNIEALSVASPAFMLISARAVDRFFAVLSASTKSLPWRSICYSSF
jgi:hypothetical protein